MQLIDFLSVSSFALVYFNKDRFILFGSLKQNVPVSPPTLLAPSTDGYFSGYNLISASPAGLMWEKQYLEKLIFNFLKYFFPRVRETEASPYEKRETESARMHSHFLGIWFPSLESLMDKRHRVAQLMHCSLKDGGWCIFWGFLCYSWSIAGTRYSCPLPMNPGL